MFIIDCFPLSKGLNKDSLTYFSGTYVAPGSLVKVNLRGQNINALVIESRDATQSKSEIKSADFQLKKISSGEPVIKYFLSKEFVAAAEITADYFATSTGSILAHLIPTFILDNPNLLSLSRGTLWDPSILRVPLDSKKSKNEISILQAPDEERFIHYRSLIREGFAKKKSIFLCLAQNEDVLRAKEKLERGIESFVCIFHNELSKKTLKEEWQKACQTEHPILIIGTAKWLFLPRDDLGTIIVEKESDSGWKTITRPFVDFRFFIENLGQQKNIRVILCDTLLRTETLYRYKEGEVAECESVKWRLPPEIDTSIVDLRETTKKSKEYSALSHDLIQMVTETQRNNSHLFLFTLRKGLAGTVACGDCGEQVRCENCNSPMMLYEAGRSTKNKDTELNFFRCHQCGEIRSATEYCKKCGSWKLVAFGTGIDRVAEEMQKYFSDLKIFELSKDTAATHLKAKKIIKSFYETRGSVLLGTEIAIPYLYKPVWGSAIVSFDSLFSIPDFRIREKIFRLILQTRNAAREKFLVQTRNPADETVGLAVEGNLEAFYKREMEDRQALNYPPFSIFIKITVRGTRSFVEKEAENLKNLLVDQNATMFNSIHEKKGEQMAVNAVLKLLREDYPHFALASRGEPDLEIIPLLKSLPSHFEIKVDPDNLL